MMDYYGGWGMFGGFGFIFMLLFWIIVIVGAVALFRWCLTTRGGETRKDATDILKERYAKGEIGKEEFEEKMKNIRNA